MLPIQRVPRGLSNLLSIFGGRQPEGLSDELVGSLELLQFYALMQRTTLTAQDGALAEGGTVTVNLGANWVVLLSASAAVVKTATMTALELSVAVNRGPAGPPYASRNFAPFGATETGTVNLPFVP